MAITASTISTTQTLEEFRLEYNKLQSDVSALENPTYGASITFEGATADAYETTLTVTDPTADRTITLPNATGTVALTGSATDIDDLDIDGGTDIGAAIVAADLFIVDDGADGTNRKTAASRIKTFIEASTVAVTGNVTASGTVEPAGDTATGDNAAIGYTSAEGLILTGQGSTNDITIKNDADTAVISIPTGATNVTVAGVLTAAGFTIGSAAITEAELEIIDGATVTTAELNLIDGGTSRGTTAVASGDGILINDAGTMAMTNVDTVSTYFASHSVGGGNIVTVGALNAGSITSGFTSIDVGAGAITTTGVITGGTVEATTDTAASDNAAIGYTSAEGLILTGQGTTSDVTIKNDADADVITIATGTTNVVIAGDLTISGDDLTMGTNTSGAALIADGTNFNPVVISGDIAINTSGVAAIGSGVIVVGDMAANSIDSAQYVDGSIDNAHIADDAIDSEHYAAGSIDTAHIADNQITLAKMAGGTDGNIISYDASGDPVAIATGSDGQVLTSGRLTLVEEVTISASTSVEQITACFSATYDQYLIEFVGVYPDTNDKDIRFRFLSGSTTSIDAGYEYYGHAVEASGGAPRDEAGQSTYIELSDEGVSSTVGNNGCNGSMIVYNPFLAGPVSFNYHTVSAYSGGGPITFRAEGFEFDGTIRTGVEFYAESGNLEGGVVRVWGAKA